MTKVKDFYTIEHILYSGWVKKYGFYTDCIGLSKEHWRMKIKIAQRSRTTGKKLFPGTFCVPPEKNWDDYPKCFLWKKVLVAIIPIRELRKTKSSTSVEPVEVKPKIKPISLDEYMKKGGEVQP